MRCAIAVCVSLAGLMAFCVMPAMGHEADDADAAAAGGPATRPSSADRAQVQIVEKDGYRLITSNGIPDHEPGRFPNRGNPNSISEQHYHLRVTLNPKANEKPTAVQPHAFGVAVNGVVFDPGTAEFWNGDRRSGWNYDALSGKIDLGLDRNNAHVQPNGAYHYHGIPAGLVAKLGGPGKMLMLGYAADGFPIYGPDGYGDAMNSKIAVKELHSSYRLKSGTRPGGSAGPGGKYDGTFVEDWEYVKDAGDLDACNGRFGVTEEYPKGTYYYVLTKEYPFVPRFWRGTADESFFKPRPGPGGAGGPGGRGPGGPGGPGGPPPPRRGP